MMTNARSRYTIHYYTSKLNSTHYQNANRFIRSYIVVGERRLNEKIAELEAKGAEIKVVYNGCGEIVKIGA